MTTMTGTEFVFALAACSAWCFTVAGAIWMVRHGHPYIGGAIAASDLAAVVLIGMEL